MAEPVTISIIINNHNYGRFLADAIDSALEQTYPHTDIVVVDDGSTDDSRQIIEHYGHRVRPILKRQGGQTSAMNAGYAASGGEVVIFLDADDLLRPQVAERAVECLRAPNVVKVHWRLQVIDRDGRDTGAVKPPHELAEGDQLPQLLREGPDSPCWSPTSGNAWARRFLDRVFPLPEMERECGVRSASADAYLSMLAPLFGHVARLGEPHGKYRLHGANDHAAMEFRRRLARDLRLFEYRSTILQRFLSARGLNADVDCWRRNSWFHRLDLAVHEIEGIVPPQHRFVLVDDGTLGLVPGAHRQAVPLVERDGLDWGPPETDEAALRELERQRCAGATFVVFAWPAFWWLEHYPMLARHLRLSSRCVLQNERVVAFELGHRP